MELPFILHHYSLICAFLLSVILTSLSIKPAQQLGWVDRPGDRKHHHHPAPLTGGITMCIAFCLSWLLLPEKPHAYTMLLTGMVLLTLIGIYDDLHSSRPVTRLLFQAGAVVLVAFQGEIILRDLGNLFGLGIVELGWVAILFTIFSIVGVINAFNMIDGLDGLAGGLALIATGWLIALNLMAPVPDTHAGHALLTLMMVIAGFLCFNLRHPWRTHACVFMGDAGSTMIGFALGWFMVHLSQSNENRAAIMTPMTAIWILALPLLDTIAIMVRRIRTGQSPFAADRQHLHHLLLHYGLPDGQVTLILLIAAILTGAAGATANWLDVPEYFQFYAFVAVFMLYYYATHRLWMQRCGLNGEDPRSETKPWLRP
ncbi:MAG: UDP-GlcNAc:undecaprenyl-phosphate/decaprenyl-phosphate GlcNAc-phosphate transferase [Pseudomonadota bacterium]|nr:UDP-GlcNAc:undecaprenyl-phosphate/decaprenyl-phosphate GlcNAc-phosphate transferase [Pseudomonadota bacterium]